MRVRAADTNRRERRAIFAQQGRAPQSGLAPSPPRPLALSLRSSHLSVCCGEAASGGTCEFTHKHKHVDRLWGTCSLTPHLHTYLHNARALVRMYTHTCKKYNYTRSHSATIHYSNEILIRLSEAFHLAFSSQAHAEHIAYTYLLCIEIVHTQTCCISLPTTTYPSVAENFLFSPSFLFLSSISIHPERYLIADSFMCDLWRCRAKVCFCFFVVMTIAAAILMMW